MQSEVAALLPGQTASNLDVVVQCRAGGLQCIPVTHRSYDPLHYVLLFWLRRMAAWFEENNWLLTAMDFYRYRLQIRNDDFNLIMESRHLMQQFAVDESAHIELCRMQWVCYNQKAIGAEKYQVCLMLSRMGTQSMQDAESFCRLPCTAVLDFTQSRGGQSESSSSPLMSLRIASRATVSTVHASWSDSRDSSKTSRKLIGVTFHSELESLQMDRSSWPYEQVAIVVSLSAALGVLCGLATFPLR